MCAGGRFQYVVRSGAASDANEAKEFDEFDEDTITFGGVEEHNDVLTYILDQDVLLDVFGHAAFSSSRYDQRGRSLGTILHRDVLTILPGNIDALVV